MNALGVDPLKKLRFNYQEVGGVSHKKVRILGHWLFIRKRF
jgi:hypothetical protein